MPSKQVNVKRFYPYVMKTFHLPYILGAFTGFYQSNLKNISFATYRFVMAEPSLLPTTGADYSKLSAQDAPYF